MSVPRCVRCGEPIGVYEPLVVVVNGVPRTTSMAAERGVRTDEGEPYHLACHAHGGEQRASEAAARSGARTRQ